MGKIQKIKEQRKLEKEQQELSKQEKKKTFKTTGIIIVILILVFFGWKYMFNKTPVSQEKIAVIETNLGVIKVKMYVQDAPKTTANFERLAQENFYNGVKFHRIIKDFMIQTGDPNSRDDDWTNDGTGGPGYNFDDEINSHKLIKGSVAMANSGPNTNGSQFFIVTATSTPWLDGKHTNFGEVTEGMDVVEKIQSAKTNENDHPLEDIILQKVYIEALR